MMETGNAKKEKVRQLIDLALCSGRTNQSPQTNLVHYFYHPLDEVSQDTIPLIENFLFALALLRSRSSDHMVEAKQMIERLLHFQNTFEDASKGNFPIYLHDFPQCKDKLLGVSLLAPFYWMLQEFSAVLGSALKPRLELAARDLLNYCLKVENGKPLPFSIDIKIAAAAEAFGKLWGDEVLSTRGKEQMSLLCAQSQKPEFIEWYVTSTIADTALALQMLYPSIANSPWSHFWQHLIDTWHMAARSYTGPALKEVQWGEEPQASLYDLFLGYFSQNYSYRAFTNHPFQLYAALIQAVDDIWPAMTYPLTLTHALGEGKYTMVQNKGFAFSAVSKTMEDQQRDKFFCPLRLLWGHSNRTHTFVNQGAFGKSIDFETGIDTIDMLYFLNTPFQEDKMEKVREVAFYLDHYEGIKISVRGKSATTFQLDDPIQIISDNLSITITFHLEEGSGRFLGHIMQGNRPSQMHLKGENRFKSFDWQIFLRTLRRDDKCKIRASIAIEALPLPEDSLEIKFKKKT